MNPQKFFYMLVGLLIALLVGGGYGYFVASSHLYGQTKVYAKRLADLQISQDDIDEIQDLNTQFRKLEGDIILIETALPKTSQQAELTLQLQKLANQSGMSISEITFPVSPPAAKTTVKKEEFTNYIANFNLQGSYDQLQKFLNLQEQLNRYTSVTNLGIAKDDKGKNLTFTINLIAYMKP